MGTLAKEVQVPWELGAAAWAAVVAGVGVGAIVQGAVAIGFGMVLVPILALLEPEALPAVPLLLAMPLTVLILHRDRAALDRAGLPLMLLGRVLGTVIAVGLLAALTEESLTVLFGVVLVAAVALTASRLRLEPTPGKQVVAATAAGVFGTTAAIGGPPLALLYQHRPGPEMRSTLNLVFFLGGLISLGGLVVAGRLGVEHLRMAALLFPALVAGFLLSKALARWLDRGWLRPAVLAFAAVSGVLAIVRGLTG